MIKNYCSLNNINCYSNLSKLNKYTYHLYALTTIDNMKFDINNLSLTRTIEETDVNIIETIKYINDNRKNISLKYELNLFNIDLNNLEFKKKLKYINEIINY